MTIFARTAIPAVLVLCFAIAGKGAAIAQRFVKDAGRPAPIARTCFFVSYAALCVKTVPRRMTAGAPIAEAAALVS